MCEPASRTNSPVLAPMAARGADVEFQADLVERVVNAGDVSLQAWEDSFLPMDLAVHGPTHTMWSTFRGSLSVDQTRGRGPGTCSCGC